MGEAAVMGKAEYASLEVTQHVDVGRFRRQRQCHGSQRCFAIQSSPSQTRAGQEMSKRFQELEAPFCLQYEDV